MHKMCIIQYECSGALDYYTEVTRLCGLIILFRFKLHVQEFPNKLVFNLLVAATEIYYTSLDG